VTEFINQIEPDILNKLNENFREYLFILITVKFILPKEEVSLCLNDISA
jgi:hypothetical protein